MYIKYSYAHTICIYASLRSLQGGQRPAQWLLLGSSQELRAGAWVGGNFSHGPLLATGTILDFVYFGCITYSKNNSLIFLKSKR